MEYMNVIIKVDYIPFHFNNVSRIMDVYLAQLFKPIKLPFKNIFLFARYLPNNYLHYPLWTQIVHDLIAYSWNNTVIIKLYV